MAFHPDKLLTGGAYTEQQASVLARIANVGKVRRWLFGSKSGQAAVHPFYEDRGLVGFLDLVQLMAIDEIRNTRRASLSAIRESIEEAAKHGIEYPFARKRTIYVFGNVVVIRLSDGTLIDASGKYKANRLIEPLVSPYLSDIGFDQEGLANLYVPMRRGKRRIELRPSARFGAPMVQPCGVAVETLVSSVVGDGSKIAAARLHNVDVADVDLALDYEKSLADAA